MTRTFVLKASLLRVGLMALLLALSFSAWACSEDDDSSDKDTVSSQDMDSSDSVEILEDLEPSDTADSTEPPVNCDEKAAPCAAESDFGSLFTKSNGRADGKLVALVRPEDMSCAWPNSSHITIQLSIAGQVQRLVVSVEDISIISVSAPLIGPAYEEGWHEGQEIDYWEDLGIHSTDMDAATPDEVVDFVCEHLELGEEVSVYAYSDGGKPSSAHQIHRNTKYPDGAVVANPTSENPTWLLFRYADQTF